MREEDPGQLAERQHRLFPARPHTLRQGADGVNKAAGGQILSAQYLQHLRSAVRRNPSYTMLAAIARFFGVSPDYFSEFSDDETARRTDEELRLLAALQDSGVRRLALCAAELSPENLAMVTALVEKVLRSEDLPDGPAE